MYWHSDCSNSHRIGIPNCCCDLNEYFGVFMQLWLQNWGCWRVNGSTCRTTHLWTTYPTPFYNQEFWKAFLRHAQNHLRDSKLSNHDRSSVSCHWNEFNILFSCFLPSVFSTLPDYMRPNCQKLVSRNGPF
jgi:hypothetical protein